MLPTRFVKAAGDDWRSGSRFHVTTAEAGAAAPPGEPDTASIPAPAPATAPALVLRVTTGHAKPKTVTSQGERVNIGGQAAALEGPRRAIQGVR